MSESIEYLFFNTSVRNLFTDRLKNYSITWCEAIEAVNDSLLVQVNESEIEAVWDELDEFYDQLSLEDQRLLEQGELNPADVSTAGINFKLSNGEQAVAQVNPEVLNRILEVVSFDEFSELIEAVAISAEHHDSTPICQRN